MTGARRDLSQELRKAQNGDVVALSQLVSAVESRRRDLGTLLHDIYTSGGRARATADIVALLDSAGWETVIVETVGVGQDEVDIMRLAHTVAVVSVPGLGDDVQAMKAGLLEVADLHVVNKADRKDAHRTTVELRAMLRLGGRRQPGQWPVPVLETIALNGTGISELADELARHQAWLGQSGELDRRQLGGAAEPIRSIAKKMILQRLGDPAAASPFGALVRDVAARKIDPHTAAARLIETRERSNG